MPVTLPTSAATVSILQLLLTHRRLMKSQFNYAIVYLGGILAFSTIYWFVRGKKFYTGPIVEAELEGSDPGRSSDEHMHKPEKDGIQV